MQQYSSQETSSYYTYKNRVNLSRAHFDFIDDQKFAWHVTANFNRKTTHEQGWIILKNWSARVDHKLHGRNFHLKSIEKRLFFIALPEIGGKSGYLHYHIMAKVPAYSNERFEGVAVEKWKGLVRTGDLFVQEIGDTPIDAGSVISYDLKDMFRNNGLEEMIIANEFWPNH